MESAPRTVVLAGRSASAKACGAWDAIAYPFPCVWFERKSCIFRFDFRSDSGRAWCDGLSPTASRAPNALPLRLRLLLARSPL